MADMYKQVDGVRVKMTAEEIAEQETLQTQWLEEQSKNNETITEQAPYIFQRRNDYPEIGDQLDMLWHSIDQNPKLKSEYFEFYEAIKAVKVKHPKNG